MGRFRLCGRIIGSPFCYRLFKKKDRTKSRWKDPAWLAWLLTVSYLLHNVEEYGIDFTGTMFGFPKSFAALIGVMPGAIFFASVNISMFWFAFPIASEPQTSNDDCRYGRLNPY